MPRGLLGAAAGCSLGVVRWVLSQVSRRICRETQRVAVGMNLTTGEAQCGYRVQVADVELVVRSVVFCSPGNVRTDENTCTCVVKYGSTLNTPCMQYSSGRYLS